MYTPKETNKDITIDETRRRLREKGNAIVNVIVLCSVNRTLEKAVAMGRPCRIDE